MKKAIINTLLIFILAIYMLSCKKSDTCKENILNDVIVQVANKFKKKNSLTLPSMPKLIEVNGEIEMGLDTLEGNNLNNKISKKNEILIDPRLAVFQDLSYTEKEYVKRILISSTISKTKKKLLEGFVRSNKKQGLFELFKCENIEGVEIRKLTNSNLNWDEVLGVFHFSGPYVNSECNEGIIYLQIDCGLECGSSELLFVKKDSDGVWYVSEKDQIWLE